MEQKENIIYPYALEKAKQIAKELISYGAKAVILCGSVAKGKKNPNDLDLTVFGTLNTDDDIEKSLAQKYGTYGISIDLTVFSEDYVNSLIRAYKKNKDLLGLYFAAKAYKFSGRHLAWPLTPLLSDEEFEYFFGRYLGYVENHPYITREYIVLEGSDYLEAKRKELHRKINIPNILVKMFTFFSFKE